MDIDIVWRTPIRLRRAPSDVAQDFVIAENDERRLPEGLGIYVFARKHGPHFDPIYIGQAESLKNRLAQHLRTNVALMKALREAKAGAKVVMIAELKTKKGQQIARVLDVVEPTLIAAAVATGATLVNKQLTSQKFHSVVSNGATSARGPFDRTYNVPMTK